MRQEDRPASDHVSSRSSSFTTVPSTSSASPNGQQTRPDRHPNVDIALIDEFPLRRASTLNLLRTHFREGARAFASVAELQAYLAADVDDPSGVVLCVGAHSVAEPPWADDLSRLRIVLSSTPLIILSDREEVGEVAVAFRRGARGYIPTNLEPHLAMEALRIVLAGGTFVPAEALLRSRRKAPAAPVPEANPVLANAPQWPARQVAVLRLLVQGKANKEIARALTMEECKVKIHVGTIMRRLGAANRTEAAIIASRLGNVFGPNEPSAPGGLAANTPQLPFEPGPRAA